MTRGDSRWSDLALRAAVAISLVGAAARADGPRVVLVGGDSKTVAAPVSTTLPAAGAFGRLEPGEYWLVPESGSAEARLAATVLEPPGQAAGGPRVLGFVAGGLEGHERRAYTLERTSAGETRTGIAFDTTDPNAVRIAMDGDPFLTLVQGETKPYFFPVIGPGGAAFTRAYPLEDVSGEDRDHPHQRSFWITHGDINGVDFWASDPLNKPRPQYGKIRQDSLRFAAGNALGMLATENAWLDPTGQEVCRDRRSFTFWRLPGQRLIDVRIEFYATDRPATFGDTKEGTLGLRVPSAWDVTRGAGGHIVNAEGLTDQAAWGKLSAWVDYSGPVGTGKGGIGILNHPDSFRYPTAWHVRDYGLFAANPFGYHDFKVGKPGAHTLRPGEQFALIYRIVLHEGEAEQAAIGKSFEAYARPPRVELEP